ncbi:MAG: 16S rRNA (cytosine(1402)-N(4))-methyltransferase RsmH [bacterium]
MTIHEPVLLEEILKYLDPASNQNFVDCTFGGGGHSLAILEKIKPQGKVLGIDWDSQAVPKSQNKNLILVNDNYKNLSDIINGLNNVSTIGKINGILLDLGLSSDQLGQRDRGFSFQSQGLLDLRYDINSDRPTATEILRSYSEQDLFQIFKDYGEEPLASAIAKTISAYRREGRPVETAEVLVQLVSNVYKRIFKSRSKKNPATRVFQALRIAVNDEFGNLRSVLPQAIGLLEPGGRLAVISFHSGEDRLVKNFFRSIGGKENPTIKILTKKPVIASHDEKEKNPRSRSAKLRVAQKL